jgi:hypothetical protein
MRMAEQALLAAESCREAETPVIERRE